MATTEAGHAPNRCYIDQDGAFHTNGSPLIRSSSDVTTVTASTLTVTQASHDGKTINISAAAGCAVTLPASTGSGMRLRFVIGATITSNTTTFTATAADLYGNAWVVSDGAAAVLGYVAAGSTVLTLNGTTQGGYIGHIVELEDVAANLWIVRSMGKATGTEATPFS